MCSAFQNDRQGDKFRKSNDHTVKFLHCLAFQHLIFNQIQTKFMGIMPYGILQLKDESGFSIQLHGYQR